MLCWLLAVNRLLSDEDFRKAVMKKVTDPIVKSFWEREFARYNARFATEAIAPIQNKVGQFISNPLIRNIIGQKESKIDIRQIMDDGKILLANLSKGMVGEDNSSLLGALLVTKIQLAAMSRIDVPEEKRKDFYLYVDEFQNFSTESFASIFAEARKYRLNLALAHQYIAQLNEQVKDSIFGNVGTLVSFLMIDGVLSKSFSAMNIPPSSLPENSFIQEIIQYSREHYAALRQEIEKKIAHWELLDFSPSPSAGGIRSKTVGIKEGWEAVCSQCGKRIIVPFQPDPARSVYCDECFKEKRKQRGKNLTHTNSVRDTQSKTTPKKGEIRETIKNIFRQDS